MLRPTLAGATMAMVIGGAALAGPFEDGTAAFNRGDFASAVSAWRPLAEQGDAAAAYNLGLIHERGEGAPQDHAEAEKRFRIAAEAGDANAQLKIGQVYSEGRSLPQSYAQAADWFTRAAKQDHASAQFSLGTLYANGRGVERSLSKATEWYDKAGGNSCLIDIGTGRYGPRLTLATTLAGG